MLPKVDPTRTSAWKKLVDHHSSIRELHMRDLFNRDPYRFRKLHLWFEDEILVDFSKNRITDETLELLISLAKECGVQEAIDDLFQGDPINETEGRSALHVALRNLSGEPVTLGGVDIMEEVRASWGKMKVFTEKIRSGQWLGYTGKPIRHLVNIGIGGSDLGPRMVARCLTPYGDADLSLHFVSNVDGADIINVLASIDPERALFFISSKSFTTQETITNALTARKWFVQRAGDERHIRRHFVAISTQRDKAVEFGIDSENVFSFWDWVGGRFSLWGPTGLPVACYIGFSNFKDLLAGAHQMDQHFRSSPLERNIPVILALISIWYVNFFGACSELVVPYDESMRLFPAYLQQLSMESNGKNVSRGGSTVGWLTAPVVWGEVGTNCQHSFFQLLHQGTHLIPADFLAPVLSHHPLESHHQILLSHFLAQTEALMRGKTEQEVEEELKRAGKSPQEMERLAPYLVFHGNRPTNTILFRKLTPWTLGALLAMYEHKIFVQGVIWNIFSFDQWGVELGKQLAQAILGELKGLPQKGDHDSSTSGLIEVVKALRCQDMVSEP